MIERPLRRPAPLPLLAVVAGAVLGGSCLAPVPPPSRTVAPPTSPAATAAVAEASVPAEAHIPVVGGPSAVVLRRVPVTALGVTADGDEAWYLREDPPRGFVGHVSPDASAPLVVAAGPTPVDLDVGPDALYVLEGVPTDDLRKGWPRVSVLERLDRETMDVLASAPITGLPVDVQLDGDRVWVGGVRGVADVFDARTLKPLAHLDVGGDGPTMVATGDGGAWLLDGSVKQHAEFVHRIDRLLATETSVWAVPGDGVSGSIAVGDRVWVATAEDTRSPLYPISMNGVAGAPLRLPRIASVATQMGSVWWLSTGAELNRIDETTMTRRAPIDLGDVGQALAVSGDRVWAATEDLVELSLP